MWPFFKLCSVLISNFHRVLNVVCFLLHTYLPVKMEQSVPKRRPIKFRPWGITQMKAYYVPSVFNLWS